MTAQRRTTPTKHHFCWLASTAVAMGVAFMAGFWIANRDLDERIHESGTLQFQEFLSNSVAMGFVTINHDLLDEAIIAQSEAEWEDRDAEERTNAPAETTTPNVNGGK